MTALNTSTSSRRDIGIETKAEILNQSESWQGAAEVISTEAPRLQSFFAKHAGSPVLFIGCGSPYYLELTAAAAFRTLAGAWAIAVPASEVLFNLPAALPGTATPVIVAVSRSGETSELIAACRKLKEERGSPLAAISVSHGTTLESLADLHIHIPRADEKSVAQTRSFSAMLLSTLGAVSVAAGNGTLTGELTRTPGQAQDYLNRIQPSLAEVIGRGFERVFFLGSGMRHGLANEGSLKMKEMSITDAEPFHFMEFRHGPQSMVDERTLVVGLVSPNAAEAETQVLREMVALGGTVVAVGVPAGKPDDPRYVQIELPGGLSEVAALPFYMPALHLLAFNQAMRKGINCDNPRNLHAWIKLPELDMRGA
jgi:glucosamine--fructose-6-phosphate aminotransferase (isomerizing)